MWYLSLSILLCICPLLWMDDLLILHWFSLHHHYGQGTFRLLLTYTSTLFFVCFDKIVLKTKLVMAVSNRIMTFSNIENWPNNAQFQQTIFFLGCDAPSLGNRVLIFGRDILGPLSSRVQNLAKNVPCGLLSWLVCVGIWQVQAIIYTAR